MRERCTYLCSATAAAAVGYHHNGWDGGGTWMGEVDVAYDW